jgi:tRNA-modifying protein YgfZ
MSDIPDRYRSFLEKGGIADLSDRVKLRLTGADRVRYLNGQVTANVQKLRAGQTAPACVTTAKGRLCAEIVISVAEDALYIDAEAVLRESLPARLERYIVADDAVLADVSAEFQLLHFIPPANEPIESVLRTGFGRHEHRRARRFGRDGVDFLLPASDATELLPTLTGEHPPLDESLLETLRIEAGVPRWGRELDENTLPPEAGLERTHIDYDKGCYIGQEVISRLKSIGHVNRRLVGFVARETEALQPGMRLFASGDDTVEIGALTSAAWSFALERPIALGYLKRGAQMGELLAREAGEAGPGRIVRAQDLPLTS